MLPPKTPCLCHLIIKSSNIQEAIIFFRFKKVKFSIYIYVHIILAKKLFNFVFYSVEIVSFGITSVNTSSTLI